MDNFKTDEKKRAYYKEYYKNKKQDFLKKVVCEECGFEYQYSSKSIHNKSLKHKMKILEKEVERLKLK